MNQEIRIIKTEEDLRRGAELLDRSGSQIGLDIEGYANDPEFWTNPHNAEIRLLQLSNDSTTCIIDRHKVPYELCGEVLRPILENTKIIKILHNSKFDLKFIKHHLKVDVEGIFDSMLASQLIEAGVRQGKGFHGLQQTLKRYSDIDIIKDEQLGNWAGELTESQIKYAAKDAQCLLPLREAMIPVLQKQGLIRCAKLEFDAVIPTCWLELCGFYLDFPQWIEVAEKNKLKAEDTDRKIHKILEPVLQPTLFGPGEINLDSHQQVNQAFKDFGIPMPESTREWMLTPLAEKYELVALLLEYRGYRKGYTSFGEGFEQFLNPVTGRIHADFAQLIAETGRYAPHSPNLNQIPKEDQYRNCFKVQDPNNTLLSADYSQLELRILADLAQDKNALSAFASGVDYHQAMAAKVFKKPLEKVDEEERYFAKRLNFGIPYGIGPNKFAFECNILESEARIIMDDYFRAVPGEKKWLDRQKWQVLRTKYARSASGRMAKYNFDDEDWKARSQAQRNAMNHPIQGSGSDIMKTALRIFYNATKDLHDKVKLVNVVHDQIDLEVDKSIVKDVEIILVDCMEKSAREFLHTVEIKVDTKINDYYKK